MPEITPEEIRKIVREELQSFIKIDRFVFDKNLQVLDARNIQTGRTTGTKIGTAADQKVAFYGVDPVVQAGAISAPSGGLTQDTEARTAINYIRTAIKNFGITA
jgi:hypothetical protein